MTVLADVHRQPRGAVERIEIGPDRRGVDQLAVQIGARIRLARKHSGHVMPQAVTQGPGGAIVVLAGAAPRVAVAQIPLQAPIASGGDHPALVSAAAPVLVGDEGGVPGPIREPGPEREGEIGVPPEIEIGRAPERHEIERASVLQRGNAQRAAHHARRKGRVANRKAMGPAARPVPEVPVEGQICHERLIEGPLFHVGADEPLAIDRPHLIRSDRPAPDGQVIDGAILDAHRAVVGVGAGAVLSDVGGIARADGGAGRGQGLTVNLDAVDQRDRLAASLEGHRHMMPPAVADKPSLAVEVASLAHLLGVIPLKPAIPAGRQGVPHIAAVVPILVCHEQGIALPLAEFHPAGEREVCVRAEFEIRSLAQRHVVEFGSI